MKSRLSEATSLSKRVQVKADKRHRIRATSRVRNVDASADGIRTSGIVSNSQGSTQNHQPRGRTIARVSRIAAIVLATFGSLTYLVMTTDLSLVLKAVAQIPQTVLLASAAALIAGMLVSGLRFRLVLRDLGLTISPRVAMHANLLGIVGGLFFFSVIGQTLARGSVLNRHGIGGPTVLLTNVYERATAVLSLGFLTLAAALYLFGEVTFDLAGGGAGFVKLLLGLVAVVAVVLLGLDRRLLRCAVDGILSLRRVKAVVDSSLLSVLMHGMTLLSFTLLGHAVEPDVPISTLASASLIVMFAAALPISFAGWGVRELSAVHAFGQIGFTTADALTVSIMVGVLSLIGLGLLILYDAVVVRATTQGRNYPCSEQENRQSLNIARATGWIVPLLAAALIPFQVYVPTKGTLLNVNLADPVAIAGGFVFLTGYVSIRGVDRNWRVQWFEAGVGAAIVAMALGFLNGAAHFGITDWAFYNRTIGFLILLSYAATGALIVAVAGQVGLRTLLAVLGLSCVAIASIDIVLSIARKFGLPVWRYLINPEQIAGMAQNPNAFALQIVLALAAIIALAGRFGTGRVWLRLQIPLMAILLIAALETGSRTGQICGIVVLGAALWLGALSLRAAFKVAVCVMLFYAALAAAQYLPAWLPALNIDPTQSLAVKWPFPASISTDSTSDVERWFSVKRGLEMWMTSPVLGAGLGAFRNQMLTEIGNPLVIHSSLVWMLAELGLAGTMVFLVPFAMILKTAWDGRKTHSAANVTLLLTLLVFGASQFVHDIFYQRIFWILFGATLFTGRFRHWRTKAA